MLIRAPWTEKQVEKLNIWQKQENMHPFTCPEGSTLIATTEGWVCECCDYTQVWVHDWMAK